MGWLCLVAVDAGLAPFRDGVLASVGFLDSLSLIDVDYLELVELVIAEGHAAVESEPSDLANKLAEMLGDGVASVESYLLFPRVFS